MATSASIGAWREREIEIDGTKKVDVLVTVFKRRTTEKGSAEKVAW